MTHPYSEQKNRTFSIVSGKGGVGKSLTAVNLAETLARNGFSVALFDAHLGHSSCAILMNEAVQYSLYDYACERCTLEETFQRTLSGVTVVTGALEPLDQYAEDALMIEALNHALHRLQKTHQIILIDAPSGTHTTVTWTLEQSDAAILLLVDEPTAVADAYRLVKRTWQHTPDFPFYTVVNFADTEAEALGVQDRFSLITEHFTGQRPEYMGWIPFSPEVRQSVTLQYPVTRKPGALRNAFNQIAARTIRACKTITYIKKNPAISN